MNKWRTVVATLLHPVLSLRMCGHCTSLDNLLCEVVPPPSQKIPCDI